MKVGISTDELYPIYSVGKATDHSDYNVKMTIKDYNKFKKCEKLYEKTQKELGEIVDKYYPITTLKRGRDWL